MNLPAVWVQCQLKDVAQIVTGNTPPKGDKDNYGPDYPWVKPPDLGSDIPITQTREHLSTKGAKRARLVPAGATLVSCIGILGKVGLAGTTLGTNQQINAVVFDERLVLPKFGFHFCKSLATWLDENSSSTTVAIVNKTRFSEAPFLLPPVNEQRRIVAKLEEILSRVIAAQERLATIPLILKRFRQSVLDSTVTGTMTDDWRAERSVNGQAAKDLDLYTKSSQRVAERSRRLEVCEGREELQEAVPESWETPSLKQLFTFIDYRGRNPPKASSGKRLITAKNIRMGYLSDRPIDFVSEETYKKWMTRGFPKKGDILFVTEGATMGFAAINHHDDAIALAQRTITLQPSSEIDTKVFLYFFMSSFFQRLVTLNATGSAAVGIKAARFRGLPIPFPPLAEQQEIVRRVEALFKTADALEARYLKAKAHVDKLTQSILAKAFRGELVPQDPYDEPAAVLLERTREQRNGTGEKKKRAIRTKSQRHR